MDYKRLLFVALFALCAENAHAARLDVSRLTQDGEFSATFGVAYISGLNHRRTSQTDFSAGHVRAMALDLEYTFLDDWTVVFSTNDKYSDSKFGVRYKVFKSFPLKFDLVANYGAAWTRDAATHDRIGDNNVDMGFHLHGIAWGDFQWLFKLVGQYVWADTGNFWNTNTTTALMYYMQDRLALKLAWDQGLIQINRPRTTYDTAVGLGVVYNMASGRTSVNPFVKYHFPTTGGKLVGRDNDNYWKIGIQFSVEF